MQRNVFTCKARPLQPSTRVIYYQISEPVGPHIVGIILRTRWMQYRRCACSCQHSEVP